MASKRTWDSKLAHPIEIGDGERLVTLRDAANRVMGIALRISPEVAQHTMSELLRAGEGGDAEDVEAATFQTTVALNSAGIATRSPGAKAMSIHDRLRGAIDRARRLKKS